MSVLIPLFLVLALAECAAAEIDASTLLQARVDMSIKQEENGHDLEEPASEESPSGMTDFQMESFQLGDGTQRCKGKPTNGWGNYGNMTVDEECANLCLRDPTCKFAGIEWLWDGGFWGICTQFDNCDVAKDTAKKVKIGADGKKTCLNGKYDQWEGGIHDQSCYWWFFKKVPAPSPVPLPPPPPPIVYGEEYGQERKWKKPLKGEIILASTPVAPDGKSAGYSGTQKFYSDFSPQGRSNCYMAMSQHGQDCVWTPFTSSGMIPVEKHGDPKGVEWCKSNGDSKKDLCEQVKAKYAKVEELEAWLYKSEDYSSIGPNNMCKDDMTACEGCSYVNLAWLREKFRYNIPISRKVSQHYYKMQRDCDTKIKEVNKKLEHQLHQLAKLNDEVVR